jgi:hypothetical protein
MVGQMVEPMAGLILIVRQMVGQMIEKDRMDRWLESWLRGWLERWLDGWTDD